MGAERDAARNVKNDKKKYVSLYAQTVANVWFRFRSLGRGRRPREKHTQNVTGKM